MKIITNYVNPPVPDRNFDWCAWLDELGADESPYGWGETEEKAVQALKEVLDEN